MLSAAPILSKNEIQEYCHKPCENSITWTKQSIISRNIRPNLRHYYDKRHLQHYGSQCGLLYLTSVRTFPTHVWSRNNHASCITSTHINRIWHEVAQENRLYYWISALFYHKLQNKYKCCRRNTVCSLVKCGLEKLGFSATAARLKRQSSVDKRRVISWNSV